ncbi:site-2 protease. Metallo peptidase. MEROPS family M50B [Anaerobranca californiensis DSM 14826]|jgi:regulator of sigma E protease|uniref:Zinc metalloprotease n=1 Tax=Anaerobranca californiensis DSM 14826 TaxID=1120989 RepID=A0A1M6KFI3_9FIRM|nr:RIP metalloprotease RseP [Anaerobranca californiensis]SHJ57679.1 site-2 protease. Metallo peptidase. MEROPS family M50B [Anaerobranca californiensis DSM 14826]
MTIFLALIVFGLLVLVHELGHFLTARAVGIEVQEFAIGFGPTIFSWKKGVTQYSLRLFPLGGYVKVLGEEKEDFDKEGSYHTKSVKQRFAFIFAGSFMNFVLAVILLFIVFTGFGLPANIPEIGVVEEGGIAYQAGLKKGDYVLEVNDIKINTWQELVVQISNNPDKTLNFKISRDGNILNIPVTPKYNPETERVMIGIGPAYKTLPPFNAVKESIVQTFSLSTQIISGIILMITGRIEAEIAGPIGIVTMVGESAKYGLSSLMIFTALLSVNLGVLNLLPIPALDGSRLVFLLVEALRGRPVDPEKEGTIHIIGFIILIIFMLFIMYKDVVRFIL